MGITESLSLFFFFFVSPPPPLFFFHEFFWWPSPVSPSIWTGLGGQLDSIYIFFKKKKEKKKGLTHAREK